jgi:rRNA maturation endonuclease Nob1
LPYLNGGMRAGFYCKQDGCEGCSNHASTSICETCGSEEDLRVSVSSASKEVQYSWY